MLKFIKRCFKKSKCRNQIISDCVKLNPLNSLILKYDYMLPKKSHIHLSRENTSDIILTHLLPDERVFVSFRTQFIIYSPLTEKIDYQSLNDEIMNCITISKDQIAFPLKDG